MIDNCNIMKKINKVNSIVKFERKMKVFYVRHHSFLFF